MKIVNIQGNINPEKIDYKRMIKLQNICLSNERDEIKITFNGCNFISAVFLPLIGSLPLLGKLYNKKISLDFETIGNYDLKKYIITSGLYNFIYQHNPISLSNSNAITFKNFLVKEHDDYEVYSYIERIIQLAPIGMDDEVKSELSSRLYELFDNGFSHSQSKLGLFCCGYYLPNVEKLFFSIYDAGIGIPINVKRYLKKPYMSSTDALKWALKRGNSTVMNIDYPRGLGFDFLKELVKLNDGSMSIYSNDAMCRITKNDEIYDNINSNLIGTLISIKINGEHNTKYVIRKE